MSRTGTLYLHHRWILSTKYNYDHNEHIGNSTLCIIIRKRAIEARMQCTHCIYSMQCNQIVPTDINIIVTDTTNSSIIVIASQQIPTIEIIVSSID